MQDFIDALDALDPTHLEEAARQVVMRLDDKQLRDHRIWAHDSEPERRRREADSKRIQAETVEAIWEAHPELKPAFATTPVEITTTDGQPVTLDDLLGAYEQWVQPTGAHDSYPPEAIITDQGRIWRNDLDIFNSFNPEAGNVHTKWTDITDELLAAANPEPEPEPEPQPEVVPEPVEPAPDPWEQRFGHNPYKAGDEITWTDGHIYEATATTTYSPESYPPHWKKKD